MATEMRADAVVIGSGPGGYVAGIRLGRLGVKTVVVEKEAAGGVCLNVGCIPSKALIHAAKTYDKMTHAGDLGIVLAKPPKVDMKAMQTWKGGIVKKLTTGVKQLLKANGSEFVSGTARIEAAGDAGYRVIVDGKGGTQTVLTKNVVIATGTEPVTIPGFTIDQKRIVDSTGALALSEVPKRMAVIGGGYIGLELGTVYAKLGSKVTVIEALDSLLSGMDPECVAVVAKKLRKMGVEVVLNARANGWEDKKDRAVLKVAGPGGEMALDADVILVAVGRKPRSKGLGLEALGVAIDERGFIRIDNQQKTNKPGIYAIGDVAGGMQLAHKASKEAEVVAEVIAGHRVAMDARTIPAVVFTDPEIASTGPTEAEAKAAGRQVAVGKFPFAALGRALSVNDTDGFVKVVADKDTGEVLALHIVGNGAADLISEGALAIEMGAVTQDMALTIHPHPTLSEGMMEGAAAVTGDAVHIVNR
ncbi:MAG TPA: dihydrolipoyl dehydrogenase [Kofleriaceae bacterium]|nr:dihydrolipoyl dehydrogenase [Kofleriaceae bacterium]